MESCVALEAYDNLNRLVGFQRGNLSATRDAIPTTGGDRVRGAAWTLSPTGNWDAYQVDAGDGSGSAADGDYADSCDLDQARTHNAANEISHATFGSAITETSGQSAWYDPYSNPVGNMVRMPGPGDEATQASQLWCVYDPGAPGQVH